MSNKISHRQVHYICSLAKFIHEIELIGGQKNVIPDAQSKMQISADVKIMPNTIHYTFNQFNDSELQQILNGATHTSLQLKPQNAEHGMDYCELRYCTWKNLQ